MDLRKAGFGFAAGAISVLVFHQVMVLILHLTGFVPNFPWSFRSTGPLAVPAIVNSMFWGGLWGVAFAFLADRIPIASDLGRGAAFGILGPWLLGNGILVPLFKGGAFLFGFQPLRMMIGALIGAAFGVGLAVVTRFLRQRMLAT